MVDIRHEGHFLLANNTLLHLTSNHHGISGRTPGV
jgi:hypothetical protein